MKAAQALFFSACCVAALAGPGDTTRVSVNSAGEQGNGASGTLCISVSPDARFIAFHSLATNLVSGDTNGVGDIFLCDRALATTERVSLADDGSQATKECTFPRVSSDGSMIAFLSKASLAPGASGTTQQVFLRDRISSHTYLISVGADGIEANAGIDSFAMSGDGRYLAFSTASSNMVLGVSSSNAQIYVRDRAALTNMLVSIRPGGSPADAACLTPDISADGSAVVFASKASNIASRTLLLTGIFFRNILGGSPVLISDQDSGVYYGDCFRPRIARSGAGVAWLDQKQGASTMSAVGYRDLTTSHRSEVSLSYQQYVSVKQCWGPAVCDDGRYVCYGTTDAQIPQDKNGGGDVYVNDRTRKHVELSSAPSATEQASGGVVLNAGTDISADGQTVCFVSAASTLVADDTNGVADVFMHEPLAFSRDFTAKIDWPDLVAGAVRPQAEFHLYSPDFSTSNVLSLTGDGLNIISVPPGAVTLAFRAPKYLWKDFDIPPGNDDMFQEFALVNGDNWAQDNKIDLKDLINTLMLFGLKNSDIDLNGDGFIDLHDLIIVLGNFGEVGDAG